MHDAAVRKAIELETRRQTHNIELIASENSVSRDVLEAVGSILTNKYAEDVYKRQVLVSGQYPGQTDCDSNAAGHGSDVLDVYREYAMLFYPAGRRGYAFDFVCGFWVYVAD